MTVSKEARRAPEQPRQENERGILRAIRRRDHRKALELIVKTHAPRLGRLCLAMSGNQAEAEELIQEILIAAYQAMPAFEGRSTISTWLYTIARRTCSRALQMQRRRDLLGPRSEEASLLAAEVRDPQQVLESSEKHDRLRRAVAGLPPTQREVLLLRFVGELRYREVGLVCGISEEAARQRASAGLRRLRRDLAPTEGAADAKAPVVLALGQEATR
jgi:RNA polymerase sigma-70 factor (ECF subfamily)